MSCWFIRCNGDTGHNQPGTRLYVQGEPPNYPNRAFNYRDICLREGFARYGMPGAGDLRRLGWRRQAQEAYGSVADDLHIRCLEQFLSIDVGDVVLLPTYERHYEVYLGVVVPPRNPAHRFGTAYYYHYDIAAGDWFENAHRVDVDWAKGSNGRFLTFDIPEIGGTWRRSIGRVRSAESRVVNFAQSSGLL